MIQLDNGPEKFDSREDVFEDSDSEDKEEVSEEVVQLEVYELFKSLCTFTQPESSDVVEHQVLHAKDYTTARKKRYWLLVILFVAICLVVVLIQI